MLVVQYKISIKKLYFLSGKNLMAIEFVPVEGAEVVVGTGFETIQVKFNPSHQMKALHIVPVYCNDVLPDSFGSVDLDSFGSVDPDPEV